MQDSKFQGNHNTQNIVNITVGTKTTLLRAQWNIQLRDEADFIFFARNTKRLQTPPPLQVALLSSQDAHYSR